MNVALKFNRITVGNFSEFRRIKKKSHLDFSEKSLEKKKNRRFHGQKNNHDMAQNYETNISLICRKSTDNWIDSLISFTVLTQCTIST